MTGNEPPPTLDKRLPILGDAEPKATYRQALETITCPPGFFVIFESITPLKTATRLADSTVTASTQSILVDLWDDRLELTVATDNDGTRWLAPLPADAPYLPPVSFSISYETILALTVDVNWGRWLAKETRERTLLYSALDSLIADNWRPASQSQGF
ncbi:hypothetical protein [Nocardia tengchongensis]|uniref:hypothetical protein n=1 Tax=Nocardia tengchongensis TaxID=2055889 RepID=UPI0036A73C3A